MLIIAGWEEEMGAYRARSRVAAWKAWKECVWMSLGVRIGLDVSKVAGKGKGPVDHCT